MGTPVIGFNVPGVRDVVKHMETGILIDSDNDIIALAKSVIRILKDEELRCYLSRNAIKWASKFTWDKTFEEFEKVLCSAIMSRS